MPELKLKNFADVLQGERIELGLTQDEMAKKLGLTRSYVSELEIGRKHPSLDRFVKICKKLSMSPNKMLGVFHAGTK